MSPRVGQLSDLLYQPAFSTFYMFYSFFKLTFLFSYFFGVKMKKAVTELRLRTVR